jgi:DNA-binding transcriptional LysR family regulator
MTASSLQRRHLQALVAVGESGSVHSAARELGMAQPALSRLLAEAERLLGGARLFERSSQGSRPTAHGEELLTRVRFVLRGLERLGEPAANARPPIRLGCIARAMHTLMPGLLEQVYPADDKQGRSAGGALRFHLTEGSSTALLDAVVKGHLDFAILRSAGDASLEAEVVIERLYDERIVIICAGNNSTLPDRPMALSRLAEQDWVLPERETGSRASFDRFWSEQGLAPIRPLIEARSFETNLALVARTRFLSIAPESIARRHAAYGAVRILRARHALPSSPVTLAFHRLTQADPMLDRFRSLIHQAARRTRA